MADCKATRGVDRDGCQIVCRMGTIGCESLHGPTAVEREASATVALDGSTRRECPTCGGEMPEGRARELHQKEQALANSAKTSQSAEEAARGFMRMNDDGHSVDHHERVVAGIVRLILSRDAAVREECDWQRMVREFHGKFGVPMGRTPTLPPEERCNLRQKWLLEEVIETTDAAQRGDIVGVADGLADVIYIALGTAAECGLDMGPIMEAVHRANMAKVPNPDGGKILKPAGWVGPEDTIAAAIRAGGR